MTSHGRCAHRAAGAALCLLVLSCRPLLNPWDPQSARYGEPEIKVRVDGNSVLNGTSRTLQPSIYSKATVYLTIENDGPGTLELTGDPVVTFADANVAGLTIGQPTATTLPSHATVDCTIEFTPASAAATAGTVTIRSNDSDESVFSFELVIEPSGTSGTAPDISVVQGTEPIASGGTFDFGMPDGSTEQVTFTVRNWGRNQLVLASASIAGADSGEFVLEDPVSLTVDCGQSLDLAVTFAPSSGGDATATLTVQSNDPDSATYSVTLTGTANSLGSYAVLADGIDPEAVFGVCRVAGDYLYLETNPSRLRVYDLAGSNADAPTLLSELDVPWNIDDMALGGGFAYLTASSTLYVYDLSVPTAPTQVGSLPQSLWTSLCLSGDVLYAIDGGRLRLIDVSTPAIPAELGSLYLPNARDIAASGDYVYAVVDGSPDSIRTISVADPSTPASVGSVDLTRYPWNLYELEVSGSCLVAALGAAGLEVYDISTPSSPALVGTLDTVDAYQILVEGALVYVDALTVVSIADPASPAVVGSVAGQTSYTMKGVAKRSDRVYVSREGALETYDVSVPASPAALDLQETSGESRSVCVVGDYAYVANTVTGLEVVNVSDPASAHVVLRLPATGGANDVHVSGSHAFVLNGYSVKVVDVSVPTAASVVGSVDLAGWARDFAVDGTWLYAFGEGGLDIIDVSAPLSPVAGTPLAVGTDGSWYACASGGLAFGVSYSSYAPTLVAVDIATPAAPSVLDSRELTGAGSWCNAVVRNANVLYLSGNGIGVVDVTDPSNPALLAVVDPEHYSSGLALAGALLYTTRRADSGTELVAYDVTDASTPVLAGRLALPSFASDCTIAEKDGIVYVASTREGLIIVGP